MNKPLTYHIICILLLLYSEHLQATQWDALLFLGGRSDSARASEPAMVGEIAYRKPFGNYNFLYHQFTYGLWQRRENNTPPDVIIITPPPPPVITTFHGAYSLGIQSSGPFYINFSHGFGFISKPTTYLGTYYQFFTSLGFGYSATKWTGECGLRHISNGSRYFGTPEINAGEEFLVCGIQWQY